MKLSGLAHTNEHDYEPTVCPKDLNHPSSDSVGGESVGIFAAVEEEVLHGFMAPIRPIIILCIGNHTSVLVAEDPIGMVVPTAVSASRIFGGTSCEPICQLVGGEGAVTDPASNDQHASWLKKHHWSGKHDEIDRPVHVPVSMALAHSLHIPVRKLNDVCHEREHHRDLNAVKEANETPVDLSCRNSEHSSNEDRPASAAYQRGHSRAKSADSHAK